MIDDSIDKFLLICEKADTKEVQKYFNNHNNLQLSYNDHEALYWFCNSNNIELIKWYLNNQSTDNNIPNSIINNIMQMGNASIIDIFEKYNCSFDKMELLKLSCRYNNNIIFFKIINDMDYNDINNNLFSMLKLTVIHNEDDLKIIKKLIEYNINNDLINGIFNNIYLYDKYKTFNYLIQFFSKKLNLDIVFYNICSYSKLEFIELFYNIFPNYDFSNNCNAVIQSFHNDDGGIIEFLLKKNTDIITIIKSNIIALLKIEELFEDEFISLSNLILAYLLFPNIDVTKNSNIFFTKCCKENRVEWADFIFKKYPHKYYLEIEENNIIKWSIKQDLLCNGNKIVTNIDQCPICLTNISNCITDCEHQFCYECLNTIYNRNFNNFNCSLCRKIITNVLNLKLN
tara:strand:- start:2051 stop:3250 length:1200 start_codon:yes stop_codon:yes gene_type:complete